MKTVAFILLLAIPGMLLLPVNARACVGIPDLNNSIVWQAFEGLATLLNLPDGTGQPFTAARTPDGIEVDATIHLVVIDYCDLEEPVPGFPKEDIWLESEGGGMVACVSGTIADANTDSEGHTQWSLPMMAGGWDEGTTMVMVNGSPVPDGVGLTLNFNSPDITGDRVVNLTDLAVFAGDYFAGYSFRSDFMRDGMLNLSDVAVMAASMGRGCP